MLDFEKELDKLLSLESEPLPENELAEFEKAGQLLLTTLNKKQTDISMQVEEIYDLVQDMDVNALNEAMSAEKKRSVRLLKTVLGLCDIIEDFYAFANKTDSEELTQQALLMWKNVGRCLGISGITRLGERGQQFDPEIHTVRIAVASTVPKEPVTEVLQSGYRYIGEVERKATVILSKGTEAINE